MQSKYKETECVQGMRTVIDLARRELSLRTNNSPNEACSSEYFGAGTDETVFLTLTAKICNVGKHPGLHAKLHCSGNGSSYDLTCAALSHRMYHIRGGSFTPEHRPRWNFHVVTKLEVRSKGEGCGLRVRHSRLIDRKTNLASS